ALRKTFGRTTALDGLDLAVRPGEVHALVALGPGPQAQAGADRAVRPGPGEEGAGVLQGQPAEGGADRRPGQRRRAADPGRADGRPRPPDGGGLPRVRR